ncbi:type II toxin-antitoxin system VapC family toxin [Botrimarina sp.]|uniref:type II toxin-antitoxin system VapC family toxin n=1 Tax=Botrimarina sp. TaxID=2795802 RepID=UPI0032ED1088
MRLLIDTNRYSDLLAGDRDVVRRFQEATTVWLSVVSIGELRSGFRRGSRTAQNEAELRELLDVRGVQALPVDEETAAYYAQTHAYLKDIGANIPINDVWIAAQALQHNLVLDTRDSDFERVPGLRLLKS